MKTKRQVAGVIGVSETTIANWIEKFDIEHTIIKSGSKIFYDIPESSIDKLKEIKKTKIGKLKANKGDYNYKVDKSDFIEKYSDYLKYKKDLNKFVSLQKKRGVDTTLRELSESLGVSHEYVNILSKKWSSDIDHYIDKTKLLDY